MLAPNVRVIEPKKRVENTMDILKAELPKRVCAYCRVSTDSEEQKTSYESQKMYYEEYIRNHPGWIFTKIYADEGISGTSMRKRDSFREMIKDALEGKLDMIICKSVSRFARNVVDILNVLEELTLKQIPVIFENENLNSLNDQQGTKMQIMLCAANAEDYSQSLSESVKWGKIRQIEQGNYPFANCYGYRKEKDKIRIVQHEAEVVKLIYNTFLNGYSYRQIARMLEERKIESPKGKPNWTSSTVQAILENEKYKGDLHLQKMTYTDLKYRKRVANDKTKQYYITDHHVAIIPKSEWNRAEKERNYRNNMRGFGEQGKSVYTSKYPFSNKIYCLQCGSKFRRYGYDTAEGHVYTWVCINHKHKGSNCPQLQVTEKNLENAFVEALNEIILDKDNVIDTVINNIEEVLKERQQSMSPAEYDDQIELKQRELMALMQGKSNMDMFKESERIMTEMQNLVALKEDAEKLAKQREMDIYRTEELRQLIKRIGTFDKFNGEIFKQLVEKIIIDGNNATFVFNNMMKITKIVK
mgnify:CR=1 FL=1